ncbi:MAG: tetratricopeptide repeat protein [Alphaproteobacteria bacterium]
MNGEIMKSARNWPGFAALALGAMLAAGCASSAGIREPEPASAADSEAEAVIAGNSFRRAVALSRDDRFAEAAPWYQRAAERDHAQAQYVLGTMYRSGKGVGRNAESAAEWYMRSARLGNAWSQFSLGNMYIRGEGLPRDPVKGAQLYELAAWQGYREAQYNLGALYYNGEGVRRDYLKAEGWFAKAAGQGDVWSQYALGRMYSEPHTGIALDRVNAHAWFVVAMANGHKKAGAAADRLARIMGPAELASSRSLARRLANRPAQ